MGIAPEKIEDIYDLSPLQQGMLYHTLAAPASGVYVEQLCLVLEGALKAAELRAAWQIVMARHAVLRTSFHWEGIESPVQVVHRQVRLPWREEDWQDLPGRLQQQRLQDLLSGDRQEGFDLTCAPLMRLILIRIGAQRRYFIWSHHHILLDGLSVNLVLRQALSCAKALSQGQELPHVRPRPFRDYILWLQQRNLEEAGQFWRRYLKGFSSPTSLGIDREGSRKASAQAGTAEQSARLPEADLFPLQTFTQGCKVTLNTLVEGAWALLLSRYSGCREVVFGSTALGRPSEFADWHEMVGLFINTLPVRVQVPARAKAKTWLAQTQSSLFEALRFEHTPLTEIVQFSEIPSGLPLFESIVVFENYRSLLRQRPPASGLRIRSLPTLEQTNYALTLKVELGFGMLLTIAYHRERFDDTSITRMLKHLLRLTQGLAAAPEQELHQIGLLSRQERHQLLAEWGPHSPGGPVEGSIPQLFESQAARTPDSIAAQHGDRQISYGRLNACSNQLCRHLGGHEAVGGGRVGILLDRSLELLTAALAVLKAGAAYVPLDKANPPERLSFMIEDSRIGALLTCMRLAGQAPAGSARTLCLDEDWHRVAVRPRSNPPSRLHPESPAYAIYTSGSTGRPKGVLVTHRNVTRLFSATRRWFAFGVDDVWTFFHSFAFDFSVWEIWGALLYGGRLLAVPYAVSRSPQDFLKLIRRQGVTVLNQTPSAFRQLLQAGREEDGRPLSSLRLVIFGGEALDPRCLAPWFRRYGDSARLINMYGITETTVHVSRRPLQQCDSQAAGSPIGRAIPDLQLLLLDSRLRPVAMGVPGEIFVGGAGLAQGYLRRPGLTAQRFLPNPHGLHPGARLYRTGDQARHLPDGSLEFLGRLDFQVKVRGFRIELGEVEALLRSRPAVGDAVVTARSYGPDDQRLTAYLVPSGQKKEAEQGALEVELRRHLQQRLPDYMRPADFVFLESLPLTPSGKLDRRALPAPRRRKAGAGDLAAPRDPVEDKLAEIWGQVLGAGPVGVQDNFFELGGHSLLAVRLVSRIRQEFDSGLPMHALFEAPTVAGLARRIKRKSAALLPSVRPVGRDGPLPLSFAQQRLWFLDQLVPDNPFYNTSTAWRLAGPLHVAALGRSLDEIVRRHETLRTRFPSRSGEAVQCIDPPSGLPLPVIDLSRLGTPRAEAENIRISRRQSLRPFNLSEGPVMRALLIVLECSESVAGRLQPVASSLLLSMHHIVSDAWSLGILLRELGELYEAFLQGRPCRLPDLPIQYADFSAWQRRRLRDDLLEREIAYWKGRLQGVPALELLTDRPRPAVQAFRGGRLGFGLSAELSESLHSLSRRFRATFFMTLLTSFQVLLHRCTGQTDLVAGSPFANRNQPETEGLIGYFINTLAIRADLSGDPPFEEALQRAVRQSVQDYAHLEVPFEKLLEHLEVERNLSRNPLFQVVFVLQNAPLAALPAMGDVTVQPQAVSVRTTRFDLEVHLREGPQGFRGGILYDLDLFDPTTIRRLAGQFQRLLEGIAAGPQRRLSELPLLAEQERSQLLLEWNPGKAAYNRVCCLQHPFQQQAARRPDAAAAVMADRTLSYRELDLRSNRLAHGLIEAGVGAETLVGVCIERSLEMLTALLGVLKAGGAYVPIDPQYPVRRIRFILQDVKAPALLTRSSIAAALADLEAKPVCLDLDPFRECSAQAPPQRADSENTAYVIFTSGSTGVPKGVVLQHRPVVNLIEWVNRAFRVDSRDSVLLVASMCFDLSVYDIFGMLAAGGCVQVASDAEAGDAELLAGLLQQGRVTFWDSAPAALQQLRPFFPESGRGSASLRLVFLSGDWIPLRLPDALARTYPNVRVIALGGATEAAIWSNFHPVRQVHPHWVSIPYGRAVPNAAYYILDRNLRPAPIGSAGDLYIGGEGLSAGYFNRPRLTAEKYLPDPFAGVCGAVLYSTGDRARWRAEGHIEFLGRLDNQVKIRGFRVELGEVSAALTESPLVEQAVAAVRQDQPGLQRLTAYILAAKGAGEVDLGSLKDELKRKLPAYMVPAVIVQLQSLPVTPNGKLDRKALPAPEAAPRSARKPALAPRNDAEAALARIWRRVLHLEEVSVEDNFFELGGDSILSIQIVAQARQAGLKLTARQVFERQTIAEQAALARPAQTPPAPKPSTSDAAAPPARPVSGRIILEGYPLSPMQQIMLAYCLSSSPDVNYMQFHWHLDSRLDADRFRKAWHRVAERHAVLRTSFCWEGLSEPLQVVHRSVEIPVREHDWQGIPQQEQAQRLEELKLENRRRGFQLNRPPLTRLDLIRTGRNAHCLVWGIHHLVADGWAVSLLLQEAFACYRALREGRSDGLTAPRPYRDYIEWLAARDLAEAEAFWRKALGGLASPSPLWIDKAGADSASRPEGHIQQSMRLPVRATEALKAAAQRLRVTLGTLLYGAWAVLLSRYGDQQDVVFGITVSGRPAELEGVESIAGLFMNNLPLRVQVPVGAPLIPWLQQLQQHLAEMRQFEYSPQNEIRQWCDVPGEMPLYESMVIFGNFPIGGKRQGGERRATAGPSGKARQASRSQLYGAATSSAMSLFSEPGVRLPLHFVYEAGRFDPNAVRRMMGHLANLLEGIAAGEPQSTVDDLPLLKAEDQQQASAAWGDWSAAIEDVPKLRSLMAEIRSQDASPCGMQLLDSRGRPVPQGIPGELHICCNGPSEGARPSLRAADGCEDRSDGTVSPTGMLARCRSDGSIEWMGSMEGAVQINARAAWPDVVEHSLQRLSGVRRAAVLARRGQPGKWSLTAYASTAGNSCSAADLHRSLKRRLPAHMVPPAVTLVEELPLTPTGEVDRPKLRELGSSPTSLERERLFLNFLYQDSLEVRLVQIWEEIFGVHPIDVQADFFQLGGNSVLAVNLVTRIQQRLGLDLPLSVFFEGPCIRQLAAVLRQQGDSQAWSPLVALKPNGANPPFFCVHAAGGNVVGFSRLVHHMDAEQPFYALQSAGLDGRQAPDQTVEEMAARYIREVRSCRPHGPYLLGGQSFGGYVAYEMARQLAGKGEKVALVALLDTWSPVFQGKSAYAGKLPDQAVQLAYLAQKAAKLYGKDLTLPVQAIRNEAPEKRLAFVLEKMRRAAIVPEVGLEQTRRIIRIHLAAIQAQQDWVAGPYAGRVTIFQAKQGPQGGGLSSHPALGRPELYSEWGSICARPPEIHPIPGDHLSMILEPNVQTLSRKLSQCIARSLKEL